MTQLAEMDRHLSPQDRARGVELARDMRHRAAAGRRSPRPSPRRRRRDAGRRAGRTRRAARARRDAADAASPTAPARRRVRAPPAPAPVAAAGGRWRVQLGAFSSEANARRAWGAVAGRLPACSLIMSAPAQCIRLQAGPLASRAAADSRLRRRAAPACFPVAP